MSICSRTFFSCSRSPFIQRQIFLRNTIPKIIIVPKNITKKAIQPLVHFDLFPSSWKLVLITLSKSTSLVRKNLGSIFTLSQGI